MRALLKVLFFKISKILRIFSILFLVLFFRVWVYGGVGVGVNFFKGLGFFFIRGRGRGGERERELSFLILCGGCLTSIRSLPECDRDALRHFLITFGQIDIDLYVLRVRRHSRYAPEKLHFLVYAVILSI